MSIYRKYIKFVQHKIINAGSHIDKSVQNTDTVIVNRIVNSSNIVQYSRLIYVTIIAVTLFITGCQLLQSTATDSEYRGQTPTSIFANESVNPATFTTNLPVTTTISANPVTQPNQDQKTISPASKPQFVEVPFTDPFGTSVSILSAQNPRPISPHSPANLSDHQPSLYPQIASATTGNRNSNPQTNPVNTPTIIPYPDTNPNIRNENLSITPVLTPESISFVNSKIDDNEIWGDTTAKTQSINEAAKKEGENLEKNRLLEIAKTKQSQDVDPKKKYMQPLSDRLGPFANREKREIIDSDITIISPVNYLQENPAIFDNKPIYDWEKEEHTAFDWSTLDPANYYKKVINKLGLGVNEEKAQQFMQEGRDILIKAKQKSDEIAAAKKLSDNNQEKLFKKSQLELEKLYREAAVKFHKASKHLPDSLLEEDALNLAGESFFFGGDYTRAFNAYQALMVKYKHSKYLDTTARRLFAIARYWEAVDRNSKITLVNFTEITRPMFDTFGYASKAYETIFINDPNNPLADDAVMAIATAYKLRGKYEGDTSFEKAAFYYKYLTENYPLSEHFDDARKGELFARSEAYMGAEYNHKTLNDAQELAEMINRSRTPNKTDDDENKAITELNENIVTKNAEREWVVGQYYDAKKYYGSAKLFYQKLIEKYPQTTYAEKARKRLEQIKNKPDKPSTFNLF
ncbi:MAG: hypothetical protein LBC74_01190 [Planctomycetaceae bacterium]|jgi:TolA-binding protein|nr:hypothetical protein [Planctomycetaceae bacterium]